MRRRNKRSRRSFRGKRRTYRTRNAYRQTIGDRM